MALGMKSLLKAVLIISYGADQTVLFTGSASVIDPGALLAWLFLTPIQGIPLEAMWLPMD